MLGKIVSILDNTIEVKLAINLDDYDNIINLYVTVEDTNKSMIGEVVDIKEDKAVENKYVYSVGYSKVMNIKMVILYLVFLQNLLLNLMLV